MSKSTVFLRGRSQRDADLLTSLYLRSRTLAMPWLISPHDEAATRWWMEHVVLATQRVWTADLGDQLVGFAAVHGRWLEQLYVDPVSQGRGAGRALLEAAKQASPGGLRLHVFTRNVRARRFYQSAGFVLVEQSDGTYTWPAPDPSWDSNAASDQSRSRMGYR